MFGGVFEWFSERFSEWNLLLALRSGVTPLFLAATGNCQGSLKCLLEAGAQVERSQANGWTPLHVAVQQGHMASIRILLEAEAETWRRRWKERLLFDADYIQYVYVIYIYIILY